MNPDHQARLIAAMERVGEAFGSMGAAAEVAAESFERFGFKVTHVEIISRATAYGVFQSN